MSVDPHRTKMSANVSGSWKCIRNSHKILLTKKDFTEKPWKVSHLLYYQPPCPLSSCHMSSLSLQCTRVPPTTLSLRALTFARNVQLPHFLLPHHELSERKPHHAYKNIKPLLKYQFHTEALLTTLTRPNPLKTNS